MKIQLVVVAYLIPSIAFAELAKCRELNRQKLLDFWSEQTKNANHCENAGQCFYLDRGPGYHIKTQDAVRLSACLGFSYSKAKSDCLKGELGVGGPYDFFEFQQAEAPSSYACVNGSCVPQYKKPGRRWAKELKEMAAKMRKKNDDGIDEKCRAQVNSMFP